MRDRFTFFRSFYESIKKLPPDSQTRLYSAVFEYALNDKKINLEGWEAAIMDLIYPNIRADIESRDSGKKGGRGNKADNEKRGLQSDEPPFSKAETPLSKTLNPSLQSDEPPSSMDNGYRILDNGLLDKEEEKEEDVGNSAPATFSIFDIIEICKKECPVAYSRHIKQANADYELGTILDELQETVSLEKIRELFAKANKTYIIKPKYNSLDLIWILSNQREIWNLEDLTKPKTQETPALPKSDDPNVRYLDGFGKVTKAEDGNWYDKYGCLVGV